MRSRSARAAHEEILKAETRYLARFDSVYRTIDARFDIRGSDLARLVMMCLINDGRLSKHRRKQFRDQVPEAALDAIEAEARRALAPEAAQQEK